MSKMAETLKGKLCTVSIKRKLFAPKTDPSLVISSKDPNTSNIAVKFEWGSTPAKT